MELSTPIFYFRGAAVAYWSVILGQQGGLEVALNGFGLVATRLFATRDVAMQAAGRGDE